MNENATYRENDRNATSDGLRAVQLRGVAHPQILRPAGGLPADDGGAEQQDLDALAGGQARNDLRVVDVDDGLRHLGGWRVDGGRLVGAIDHGMGRARGQLVTTG